MSRSHSAHLSWLLLCLLPLAVSFVALGVGRYSMTIGQTFDVLLAPLTGHEIPAMGHTVVFNIRMPRILLALVSGAGLSASGAAFQSLFGNPLATPDTLGVATGASFGAVLALLFSRSLMVVQLLALAFGLAALLLTGRVSRIKGQGSIVMVVLAGMVVSALFQALVSMVKYVADPEQQLPTITYWLLGSMSRATYRGLLMGAPLILFSTVVLFLLRWRLNVLSLQEDEARSLGVDVVKLRLTVMVSATLATASCVSMCGQVGWIGLLVPHGARLIWGSDNVRVMPASVLMGATFMVVMDTLARSILAAEIPVSILTALIGAPCFITLLRRSGGARL